jgi:uncharacterized protein YndB with AHSA1/START domain
MVIDSSSAFCFDMREYEFLTVWHIPAPLDQVWDAIEDADGWPKWWRGVLSNLVIKPGESDGTGSVRRSVWKSRLPYKLEFDSEIVRVEKHRLIEARAFGELTGTGVWQFFADGGDATTVHYDWRVVTTKSWMNALAPIAKPFFRWNHDVIMRWGEEGLKKYLNAD